MPSVDLSVIIPARNEQFAGQTANNILDNARGSTEVLLILDGYWPDPPIHDRKNLHVIHLAEAIGQRAATNLGVRVSQAKYVMKLDAHCSVDEGFDIKLMNDYEPGCCLVPAMHHLHAFDWVCNDCGTRTYQGAKPAACSKCSSQNTKLEIVWKPRYNRPHISYRFDRTLHFQYWEQHRKRPECQGNLVETMSFIGACMFMDREHFLRLGGMDEAHGSWGQFGTEISCKVWLSGGRLLGTRNTWFAHMFRTGNFSANGGSTWPYPISQQQIDRARSYSQDLWLNDKWPQAIHPLSWLVDRFKPVPDWH